MLITPNLLLAAPQAAGQVQAVQAVPMVIGFEDFDGGAVNLSSTTQVYDYQGGSSIVGAQGGSAGDAFGRVGGQLGDPGMPYGLADDSVVDVSGARTGSAYPGDYLGLAGQHTTAFFGMYDMDGGDVSGDTFAIWSFSGWSGSATLTSIEIDFAAMGDYESTDIFTIDVSVDGGAYQTIFNTATDEAASLTYRAFDDGDTFTENDPLEMVVDGTPTGVFLDKCDPATGDFDTFTSTSLAGQTPATSIDVRVTWAGTPGTDESTGIDNITINADVEPVVEVLGYEDFDGGEINLSSTANVFDFGTGGGSAGDAFGRIDGQAGGTGAPYDIGDDSVVDVSGARTGSAYPADTRGIAGQYTTAFFGMNDPDGLSMPAVINDATWTFSGWGGIATLTDITIDIAALGDFELASSDGFSITASIDGGPFQTIFAGITDEDASKIYRLMDSGATPTDTEDPLELYIDGVATGTYLDKCDPATGAFDTFTSTLLSGQTANTSVDIRVSWAGAPSGSEPMGFDNITVYGTIGTSPDTTAPEVQSLNPADDSTDVDITTNLAVTFNESVQKSTGNITIHLASDNSIVETVDVTSGAVTVSGGTVTIDPVADLSESTEYYVQIAAGAIEDLAGNPFAGIADTTTWSFTTVAPTAIVAIYDIQGNGDISPYLDATVITTGTVTGFFEGNASSWFDGFFIQTYPGDGDPSTSDGLFVNVGSLSPMPSVGDLITVTGTVEEMTEYSSADPGETVTQLAVSVLGDIEVQSSGNPVTAEELVPDGTVAYFEAREGMYLELTETVPTAVDAGAYPVQVVGPTSYGTIYVVRGDEGVTRVMRGSAQDGKTFGVRDYVRYGNGTPDLIVGSTVNSGIEGPLTFSYGNYLLAQQNIGAMAVTAATEPVTPTWSAAGIDEITFASYNTYNLDSTGTELTKDVMAIVNMGCPTFVGLQEIDVSTVITDMISDLAAESCFYDYGYSHADVGGRGIAVLYRTDMTSGVSVSTDYQSCSADGSSSSTYDPLWTTCQGIGQYPLFSRRPVVITATVSLDSGPQDVTVIANHFKSKLGGTSADQRRLEQGIFVGDMVDMFVASNADAQVVVLGDLNDFEDSAPLAALTSGGRLSNLWYQLGAGEHYSYIYNGTSQILDHILVTPNMLPEYASFSPLHHNSDFSYDPYSGQVNVWRSSDHDPLAATFDYSNPSDVSLTGAQAASGMQAVAAGAFAAFGGIITWMRRKLKR